MQTWDHPDLRAELDQHLTFHKWGEDYLRIKLPEDKSSHRFYPVNKPAVKPATAIRLLKLGAIPPERIGSIHELNRYIDEPADKLTINYHYSDRLAMMYYGHYHREDYIDVSKIDMPEMRVSPEAGFNDPMVMDPSLKLIDVHYVPGRDNPEKIHADLAKAVTDYVTKRGVEVKSEAMKLYWNDKGKWVKFYSGAPLNGHYYFYINLGIDYNAAIDYFHSVARTKDKLAYGLPKMPATMIDDVLKDFATLYGLPIEAGTYTSEEKNKLAHLDKLHKDKKWIEEGVRNYPTKPKVDGFEHEFDLATKPDTNIFEFELEHSGLDFFYQPALTRQEVADGRYRPDHVVGSYAVYHKTKVNNQYQAGKFAHIYRPVVADAAGNEVNADLNIENDTMTITVPQEFLDNATYPVTIDPTFGYTTAGASNVGYNTANAYINLQSITGSPWPVYSYSAYINPAGGASYPINVVSALYSHGNGGTRRDYTAQTTYTSTVAASWITFNSIVNYTASASSYDIGMDISVVTGSYAVLAVYYDSATNAGGSTTSNTYSSPPPASQDTVTLNNDKYSLYVTALTNPSVQTNAATNITSTSATLNGNVLDNGGGSINEDGFAYSTIPGAANLIYGTGKSVNNGSTGAFSTTITGLTPGTVYYFAAFAGNTGPDGTYGITPNYGAQLQFQTLGGQGQFFSVM